MDTNERTFKLYADSGHSWIAVKRNILAELNLLEQVSHCSYQKGATVYVESGSDGVKFTKAFVERFGCEPKIVEKSYKDGSSQIRTYERFSVIS